MIKYVPIMRWKAGEKNCLKNLSTDVSNQIIPFIEVAPLSDTLTDEATEKKLANLFASFNATWENRPFFLYLPDEWYTGVDTPEQITEIYEDFYSKTNHSAIIPAFDIADEINISNHSNLPNANGVCLRVNTNNFESINHFLTYYVTNAWITPGNTDLLLDLKYIDEEIYPKKAALTTALADIPNISEYRSIIVASCSFPKDVSTLQANVVNEFVRHEASIHKIVSDLTQKYPFNYVYADYGPMNLNEAAFAPYMVPNFKIKYTTSDKYLIVKGLSLKKGGLDLVNVVAACRLLISHPQFSGENFSYGDKIISSTANGTNLKTGNLTNWVEYSFNHHITLIASLM